MLTRFHKILIGLFVAQLALAAGMLARHDDAIAAREVPVLAGFDAAKVTSIVVSEPNKQPVLLRKQGEAWVLGSSFDYPVDATKVTDLLTPLAKMAASAPVATQATRHKQFHVDDGEFERKLVITASGKDTTLYIGKPAGARRTAVRLANDARVWAVPGVTPWSASTEPRAWIDTSYVKVPTDQVAKLVIDRDGHRTELAKASPWSVTLDGTALALAKDESLDTSSIDAIVNAVTTIDASQPADPKRDASKPTATFTIERTASGTSPAPTVIDVIADGTSYWVRDRSVGRAVLVDKARLDPAVTVERSKLVKHEGS